MGFTLNQITMLALMLVVGIVIDDAIVVLENIFRFIEEKKLSAMEAAVEGTKDIGLAVLATTLSLVIIFLPVAMMSGIVGRFMSSFGYTAAFAIMVSLLVSFTLTPDALLALPQARSDARRRRTSTKDTLLFRMLAGPTAPCSHWSMRHRWVIVAVCRPGGALHRAAVHGHRQGLPADGRPERVRGHRAHAGRLFARRHRRPS